MKFTSWLLIDPIQHSHFRTRICLKPASLSLFSKREAARRCVSFPPAQAPLSRCRISPLSVEKFLSKVSWPLWTSWWNRTRGQWNIFWRRNVGLKTVNGTEESATVT